jgi:branched-chain amino acid transport system ATP-binding protein
MPLLQTDGITLYFGGLRAVNDFRLSIEQGQVRGLIGPNGAGKTTIFNMLTGIYKPSSGDILYEGKSIVGMPPHKIAALGIGRTFQNMRLWRHVSVLDHVKLAQYSKIEYGVLGAFLGTPKRNRQEEEFKQKAESLLELLGVRRFADQIITGLPYGVQRRVEIARAMALEPKLLLLDEPTAGMNPEELAEMVQIIRKIKKEFNLAIFLIEHRMRFIMDLCDRIQTLDFGEVIAEGTPEEIRDNPRVIDAYLGREVET